MYFLLLSILVISSEAAKFPKNWTKCKISDPKLNSCLNDAIQVAIVDLANGKPSLGVLPVDPLHFNSLSLNQGTGPVNIKLDFTDLDMVGLKNMNVTRVKPDWKKMEIDIFVPTQLSLLGRYKINGQVLVLPIKGEGKCSLIFDQLTAVLILDISTKKIGKSSHYHVDKFHVDLDAQRLRLHFENLFGGDKALGEGMNRFLNENWQIILGELKSTISTSFGTAFREITNRIFSKLDINTLSPP